MGKDIKKFEMFPEKDNDKSIDNIQNPANKTEKILKKDNISERFQEEENGLELFQILKDVKRRENMRFASMSREEKIDYVVAQMNAVEQHFPEMVEDFELTDEKEKGFEYER